MFAPHMSSEINCATIYTGSLMGELLAVNGLAIVSAAMWIKVKDHELGGW